MQIQIKFVFFKSANTEKAPCELYGVPVRLEEAGLSLLFEACLIQQSGDQIGNNPL